ncbi:BRI1-associated receptor kinase [Perilla frutescens var. frutescens]|nr:BRI1-associated receptor kinase [Perilla frutescens var. frutescens]
MLSSSRDNWVRLVTAVVKKEQYLQLCHMPYSTSPSIRTESSDRTSSFSENFLNYSSEELEPISGSPFPQLPLTEPSVSQVTNNTSRSITRKLFSTWYRRRKSKDECLVDIPGEEGLRIHLGQFRRFSLQELQIATENFSNKIKYGYSTVYKGLLADGSPVAIKRYRNSGNQSAKLRFEKDIKINSIAAHPHVLHMLGVCITPKESFLIYPVMINGSVASCLRGRRKSEHPLNWPTRKRVALGVAWGLTYLHYGCNKKIIHRDLKAANILLNDDWEAVVADFELAVIMDCNVSHVNTSIVGTIGCMAPEYLSTGTCSEKTDVFAYGIFLLELITGQRAFDLVRLANDEDVMLLGWIKRNYMERKWELIVDPDCEGNGMEEVVQQLMQIAIVCTHSNPATRPKMFKVVGMLEVGNGSSERWKKLNMKRVEN